MTNCIVIPYDSMKQKIEIMKANKNIKFSDLGNCLMNLDYVGNDEARTGKLIKEYKQAN